MWTCVEEAVSVDSLEIDISAEKADQAVEDVALGDICNEDRDVISFQTTLLALEWTLLHQSRGHYWAMSQVFLVPIEKKNSI